MNAPHDLPADHGLAVPPHSLEAEQSILGALMTDNEAIDRIGSLRAEHFYRYDHRVIFEHISKLILAGRNADIITVLETLGASGKAESVGGLAYLNAMVQSAPGSAGIVRWAEIVIDRAKLRGLISAADEISSMAFHTDGKTVTEIIDLAQSKLEPLTETRSNDAQLISAYLPNIVERIDAQFHGSETKARVWSTGLRDLDAKLGGGMRGGQLIVVAGRPSMGKAQPLDASVLRNDGTWARMGNVAVGDALASVDGAESVVTGVFPQGSKRVYRVKFSDGRSTEACGEHLWAVRSSKWTGAKVLSTDAVAELMKKVRYQGRMWVESATGHFGSAGDLPIDPWLMGALLGDGDFTGGTPRFAKGAAEIVERVRATLPEGLELVHAGGVDYRISQPRETRRVFGNDISNALAALGLSGCNSLTKFVPQCYLEASRDTRLAVLRGLLDTDGWVEKTGSVQFSTASKGLSGGVVSLARSLGYWVTVREKHPKYSYKGEKHAGALAYVSTISGARTSELFLFSEKAARCIDSEQRGKIRFESIEYSRDTECQCISVSHPSHLYVTDDYIVTHNTAIALGIAESTAQDSEPSLFFSQEMEGEELCNRALSRASGLPLDKILDGKKFDRASNSADWTMLTKGVQHVADLQLIVDARPGMSLNEIRSQARMIKRRNGLGLIVVDYLGLMAATEGNNRTEQVGANSRGLKALAKQLGVPVVLLSQLNRGVEQRPNKRPMMSDLRDSGEIEQDADIIIFLYRDEVYNPDSPDKGLAEINVAKQRNGPTGIVRATYIGERTLFADMAPGYVPVPRQAPEKARRGFE